MSQTVGVLLRLRELILSGALPPGERLSETTIADRLGASRTPVRAALARLADEGLLSPIPSGGFAVRAFTEHEIRDAIEMRGMLEGLAARLVAERGAAPDVLARLQGIVRRLDAIMATPTPFDMDGYVMENEAFHTTLLAAADNGVLERQLSHLTTLPFASPSAFLSYREAEPAFRTILLAAQEQHRAVMEAIEHRQGTRAEGLMQEHARQAHRHLTLAMRSHGTLTLAPGAVIHLRRRA